MRNFKAILKRELKSYFESPVAYVFIVIFLLATTGCTFFISRFFENRTATLEPFFVWHPWLYLFLVPAVGMRLWSEERKSGTIELLFTLPVTMGQALAGKFIAAWLFLGIALLMTFPMVLTVAYLGSPDYGIIFASYLGSFLLAGGFLSVTCLFSAMSKNQVISFVLSVVACFAMLMLGVGVFTDLLNRFFPVWLSETISAFSFFTHFQGFQRGLIDSRDLVFFVSIICFMLAANAVVLERKKSE
ncbi:MAG: gliding motility-associated transport system permease protein [Clostridiales bacterium]|jgi:ABC-2 type transport system permease protein|nr:gliding motility-associated transport system permease protein [Clostridiales bacterium]MDN5283452.1 gliding motility-associated transport system permease protein [Candidatus Ozemobacter sp.]